MIFTAPTIRPWDTTKAKVLPPAVNQIRAVNLQHQDPPLRPVALPAMGPVQIHREAHPLPTRMQISQSKPLGQVQRLARVQPLLGPRRHFCGSKARQEVEVVF